MDRPLVGVALIVRRRVGLSAEMLLHKRKGKHSPGTWACPGGHFEMWETFEECSLRELREEAGHLKVTYPVFLTASNTRFYDERRHYVTIFLMSQYESGEPEITEPEKNEGWGWFDYEHLPEPLMMGIDDIKHRGILLRALALGDAIFSA